MCIKPTLDFGPDLGALFLKPHLRSHLIRGVLVKLNYLLTNGGYIYNIQYLFLTTNVEKFQNPECGKVLINFVYF